MLPLHVGGDLDPRHVDSVDRHLSGCLPCFREFRELAAMRGRLAVLAAEPLPEGVLDGFTEEVMARVAVGEPGPKAVGPRPGPRMIVLPRMAAAAAMLLVALAGWRLFSDAGFSRGAEQHSVDGETVSAVRGEVAAPLVPPVAVPWSRAGAADEQRVDPQLALPPGLIMPSDVEQLMRAQGGHPAQVYLLRLGVGNGLTLDPDADGPRSRDR